MKGNQIHFEVEASGRVVVTRFESWECRGDCSLEFLCDLIQNWPELFVGRSGGISFGDYPPDQEWADSLDLAFSSTKRLGQPADYLPLPCPYTLRWPQVGIPNAESMMAELLENHSPPQDERIFWIGGNTHPSRIKLCEMGRNMPHLFDTEIIQWNPHAPGGQRSKTRQVSIPDHAKYKYLIDCQGGGPRGGYSARIKWLLATGRPLFIVDREYAEHWHEDMHPWVHYVPVKADLSDLLEQHARLEADPDLYESIGRNARQFAAENLTVEALLHRTAEAVWNRINVQQSDRERVAARLKNLSYPIPIIAVYSSNIQPLYENFVSSLDPARHGFRLISERIDLSDSLEFGFQTESWYRMLIRQVEFALQVMENEIQDGDYFIVSDIDIHFFSPGELRKVMIDAASAGIEFTALLDRPNYYNSGFIVLQKCRKIVELYKATLQSLRARRVADADQEEFNRLIREFSIKHRPISPTIGALGKQPVHEETLFYHATFAGTLQKKLKRIETARNQMRSRTFGVWQNF
ncbi:MAG TPA: glycosyl transferase family 90 [Luteolibacter sp.]